MVNAAFKQYKSYQDFVTDILFNVLDDDNVAIICNYKDYNGLISSLNEKTINGNSLYLNKECMESFDEDIATAQSSGENMLITIFANGEIVGEPLIYTNPEAFVPMTYFVEYDARSATELPISGTVIPFQIKC